MQGIWNKLAAPALALGVLTYLVVYCLGAAWFDYLNVGERPAWAYSLWLDRPFRSPLFLMGAAALLLSTFACTLVRLPTLRKRWGGAIVGARVQLERRPDSEPAAFLLARGFRGRGPVLFRNRCALWGGWVMHVGLIALMLGVLAEQAFRDSGTFYLSPGQTIKLTSPGEVFGRETGPLAPASPPEITLRLEDFDPALHQAGYDADRASRLQIGPPGEERVAVIDRAAGVRASGAIVYQASRFGPSLRLRIAGESMGRALHLEPLTSTLARAAVTGPSGGAVQFWARSEQPFEAPTGPGRLDLSLSSAGREAALTPGQDFDFDGRQTRLLGVGYWSAYTYRRTAGMPAVWFGFGAILVGCVLLAFPAGVARLDTADAAAEVYLTRGADLLASDWRDYAPERDV